MTRWIALLAGLLALTVAACVQAAPAAPERNVVVVVAGGDPAVLAEARAAVAAAGDAVQLRAPRTATEQLSVTHYFAARGYDVAGVGLDHRVAVAPVAEEYPDTRFDAVAPGAVATALAR